ncbi:hypothetical protein D9M69_731850 [compost metagenome]
MTDGAGREINAGHFCHIRMITQRVSKTGIAVENILFDITIFGKDWEKPYSCMALSHQKAIAIGPCWIIFAKSHHIIIKARENLGG